MSYQRTKAACLYSDFCNNVSPLLIEQKRPTKEAGAWDAELCALFGVAPGLIFEVTDPAVVESLDNCLQLADGCETATAVAGG